MKRTTTSAWILLALACAASAGAGERETRIGALIGQAGNAYDEKDRCRLLGELAALPDLDATLRADLAELLPVVDQWANGKEHVVVDTTRAAENGYLCRFIGNKVRPESEGPVYPPSLSEGSPLRPIWCFYRGRMLIWR